MQGKTLRNGFSSIPNTKPVIKAPNPAESSVVEVEIGSVTSNSENDWSTLGTAIKKNFLKPRIATKWEKNKNK